MAHSSNYTKIWAESGNGLTMTELHNALGVGGGLGASITNGTISPMAKYKAVRHSSTGALSVAQRAASRYGFATSQPPQLNLATAEPTNNWSYLKPRGSANSEWFRMLDFNGYVTNACAPLVVSVGQLVYDGESIVLLYGNGTGNGVRTDNKTWVADESLSLAELLQSASDFYSSYYLSLLLVDTSDNAKSLVVTGITASAFVSSYSATKAFSLYGSQTTVSGVIHPAVSILASGRRGHTFRVIACLSAQSLAPTSGYAYKVHTDTTLTPYSLGFESGCDRASATLASASFNLDGMSITSIAVSYVDMTTEISYGGQTWRAFKVSVDGVFSTIGAAAWVGVQERASGTLQISNSSGYVFGAHPSSGSSSFSLSASVLLSSSTSGQTRALFVAGSDKYLWVMKNGSSYIGTTASATLTLDTPLTTAISKTGTKSIP